MSSDNTGFTKENLDRCLAALGKEFRKRNGTAMPAELVLIGGAAVLENYGFRDRTYDVDAIIQASSTMKEAANHVGDIMGLPSGWLNMDFIRTSSYTPKLLEHSVYYRTFSNILAIRTVRAEYLIAMKLVANLFSLLQLPIAEEQLLSKEVKYSINSTYIVLCIDYDPLLDRELLYNQMFLNFP